jgi:membrane-associated phospholipid phosphatase
MTVVALARGLPGAGLLLAGWALLVGFARVALGVHYLLDVAAGYLLGLAIGAAVGLWFLHGLPW